MVTALINVKEIPIVARRAHSLMMLALLLASCSIPSTETQTGIQATQFPDGNLTILNRTADIEPQTRCVTRVIQRRTESSRFVPAPRFRAQFFPWFELSTAPESFNEFHELLGMPAVKRKLQQTNIRYIILLTGETLHGETEGGIAPLVGYGAAGFFGYAEVPRESLLTAVIWNRDADEPSGTLGSKAQGRIRAAAFFVPVAILSITETAVCDAMAEAIIELFALD